MSEPPRIILDPARVARHFSALQPADDPVQSAQSTLPACCTQTAVQIRAAGSKNRTTILRLPFQEPPSRSPAEPPGPNRRANIMTAELPEASIQVLAPPEEGGEPGASLVIQASGPAECPPGRGNEVQASSAAGTTLRRQIPFAHWSLPLFSTLDFAALSGTPGALIASVHPWQLAELPPAVCLISVPGCAALPLQATVAVFPDVRWEGKVQARAEADETSQSGFRIHWEGGVNCAYGSSQWRPQNWPEVLAWCPWLGVLDTLARSLAAIVALRRDSRAQGLDNRRLDKTGSLDWKWPKMEAAIESSLYEDPGSPLLGHRLAFHCASEPLLGASGEMSLLSHWLENPLWLERLAPLLVGIAGQHVTEVAHELGIWLVADGQLRLTVERREDRPQSRARSKGDARGAVSLRLEGRTTRDYEAIVVRAGSAKSKGESAGFSIGCTVPPEAAAYGDKEDRFHARVAFSGLALWSVEKWRPGIQVRRLSAASRSADAAPLPPAPPLAALLSPRVWPAEAIEEPAPVAWHPA